MNKTLHVILFISFFCLSLNLSAQQEDKVFDNSKTPISLYSSINFEDNEPCNCNQKTERTHQLSRGIKEEDLKQYYLHAYLFSFKNNNPQGWAKLFKALETDPTVYKVSVKEWDGFMLLTTEGFDIAAFEIAAQRALDNFSLIMPEEYLKVKNVGLYNTYILQQTIQNNSTR